jgi:hypothetical protein
LNKAWIYSNWKPVTIDFEKKEQAVEWCYKTIGPDTKYIACWLAGWMHETHREGTGGPKVEVFFFKRKSDAVAFKLAIGSKEGY